MALATKEKTLLIKSLSIGVCLAAGLFLTLLVYAQNAQAASLYISPASGEHKIGDSFSVSIYLSSASQAANAASGVVIFPQDKLTVAGVSKSGSIFSLWAVEPTFSNAGGTVNFEGIILNPGFKGAAGKILTITFKVKAAGTASIKLSSGSILANDGKGTNILESLSGAKFILTDIVEPAPTVETPSANEPTPPPATVVKTLAGPNISSPTNPDQSKWSTGQTAVLSWPLPAGVTAVRLLVDQTPTNTPTVIYSPAIKQKQITNLTDGVWYFHAQFRNAAGWGAVANYVLRIDSQKPNSLTIDEVPAALNQNFAKFVFTIANDISGIDYYQVQIDNSAPQTWRDDGSHTYQTAVMANGGHNLTVTAFDKAGNFLTVSKEFVIAGAGSTITSVYAEDAASSTEKLPAAVNQIMPDNSDQQTGYLMGIILLVALAGVLLFIIFYFWHKLALLKQPISKKNIHITHLSKLDALKEDMQVQMHLLNKTRGQRQIITRFEEKVLNKLRHDLDEAEKLVAVKQKSPPDRTVVRAGKKTTK